MESLLQLDKFCQAAVCTRQTQFYEISIHQWTKLLQLQQNRPYVEMMMKRLQLRISSRLTRLAVQHVPLYSILLKQVNQLIHEAESEARKVCMLLLLHNIECVTTKTSLHDTFMHCISNV